VLLIVAVCCIAVWSSWVGPAKHGGQKSLLWWGLSAVHCCYCVCWCWVHCHIHSCHSGKWWVCCEFI